uniref:IBB domain-containing protein n=1 Tax=Anopheles minimus TaxID=112268 RepID=A0A182W6N5_9DIPT
MNVDDSPLEHIRTQKRYELKWEQKTHRKKELDRNRAGLGELHHSIGVIEHISEQEIKGLAGRIKRRKRCDPLDLVRLSYGFQQSRENISHFIRTTGAINVIVKELTGHDYNLQLLAAECLCNLSLGDDVCCEKIANFAGTYLIALAENPNCRPLQQTCFWTLQNIVGSSPKGSKLLFTQGLVDVLVRLLSTVTDQEAADDIILTLELALNYEQDIEPKIIPQIVQCFVEKQLHPSSLRLLYKCYGLMHNDLLLNGSLTCIIRQCLDFLTSIMDRHLPTHAASILLSIRILAHHVLASADCIEHILQYQLHKSTLKFSTLFNDCAKEDMLPVCKELLWLLGQIHSNGGIGNNAELLESYLVFDNFVEQIAVPKALV